jgi:hypothetical protein
MEQTPSSGTKSSSADQIIQQILWVQKVQNCSALGPFLITLIQTSFHYRYLKYYFILSFHIHQVFQMFFLFQLFPRKVRRISLSSQECHVLYPPLFSWFFTIFSADNKSQSSPIHTSFLQYFHGIFCIKLFRVTDTIYSFKHALSHTG